MRGYADCVTCISPIRDEQRCGRHGGGYPISGVLLRGGCITCPLLIAWLRTSSELKDQSWEFQWSFRSFSQGFPGPVVGRHPTMSHHSRSLWFWRGKVEGSPDWFCCTGLGISMQVMRPIGISQPFFLFDDFLWQRYGAMLWWGLYILQSWKTQEGFSISV